jgi:adenylyltransferase/sulfurtransferase
MEIAPQELKQRLDRGERIRLIDVREPHEYQIARIEGAELIPMLRIPQALPSLGADRAPVIVYCHHGVRSLDAAHWLREQGVDNCLSMAGGIDRWSLEVDPSVPRY